MTQKTVAEARAFGCALDQSRNIGDDEAVIRIGTYDAELRCKCRERVVGDLGTGGGDRADQRRLSSIRHAEQTDIGQHSQFQA